MIVEWFLGLAGMIADFFLGFLPDADWSDGMVLTASNALASIFTAAGQISNWFPFPVLAIALGNLIGWYIVLFGIRIIRWLWGLTPFSGGS